MSQHVQDQNTEPKRRNASSENGPASERNTAQLTDHKKNYNGEPVEKIEHAIYGQAEEAADKE